MRSSLTSPVFNQVFGSETYITFCNSIYPSMFEDSDFFGGGFGNSFPLVGEIFTRMSAFVRQNQ